MHVRTGVAVADLGAVVGRAHADVRLAAAPRVAELVRRDGERAERGGRLALEEPEALRELGRDQAAQRAVVREHDEADVVLRVRRGGAERGVTEHDADLGLEVEAPRRIAELDRVARPEQVTGAALIDERIGLERLRRLGTARLADQDHVIEERGAVDPFVRARERCAEAVRIDRHAIERAAIELIGDRAQLGLGRTPVIECPLQGRPRLGSRRTRLAIAAHHEEAAISGSIAQGR